MISRDDENSTNMITLNILPPKVGMFKLSIFGMPRLKPNQRGKLNFEFATVRIHDLIYHLSMIALRKTTFTITSHVSNRLQTGEDQFK